MRRGGGLLNCSSTAETTSSKAFEVAIVQARTARRFPDALDGVQFGAAGWQKVQRKFRSVLFPPSPVGEPPYGTGRYR